MKHLIEFIQNINEKLKKRKYLYLSLRLSVYLLIAYYLILPFLVPLFSYQTTKKLIQPSFKYEDIYLTTPDKVKLNVWYIPAKENKPTIIFCHGNGTNMSYNNDIMSFFSQHNYGVILFDYRGFGKSTGKASGHGLFTDLESVIKYLKEKQHIPENKIVLWGHSLGSNIVVEVATRHHFKCIILQGSSTSVKDMSIHSCDESESGFKVPFLCKLLAENFIYYENYDNKTKISKINSPILIVHAKNDETVPVEMAYRLAKLNPRAQLYISESGTHNSIDWAFEKALKFISTLQENSK